MPILAIILVLILSPIINEKFDVNIFSIDSIQEAFLKITSRSTRVNAVGSVVDFGESNFLIKMLAFSYLPLIYEANNVFKYLVSFENLFLLMLLLFSLLKKGGYRFIKSGHLYLKVMLGYSLITWFFMGQTIYNLGLSSRQKYMYIPFLYIIILLFLSKKKHGIMKAKLPLLEVMKSNFVNIKKVSILYVYLHN